MYMVTKRISNIWAFGFATVDFMIVAFWLFNWHIVMERKRIFVAVLSHYWLLCGLHGSLYLDNRPEKMYNLIH